MIILLPPVTPFICVACDMPAKWQVEIVSACTDHVGSALEFLYSCFVGHPPYPPVPRVRLIETGGAKDLTPQLRLTDSGGVA